MSTDYSWHTIAVGNGILGVYNFVVLAAPPDWRIVIMPMASDVFSHVDKEGVKWVRDGEIRHFVKAAGSIYELEIRVRPGKSIKLSGEVAEFGGHEAVYAVRREGLLKKSEALVLETYCPETDRTISIKIKGKAAPLEIIKYLKYSKCH